MFQLIVAVIAILLIAIMVLAAMYYGGDAHTEASLKAQYAGNMNSAAQIEGAMQLYYQENAVNPPGENEALLQHLVDTGYLKEIPEGDWTVQPDTLYKPILSQTVEACAAMNRVAGFDVSVSELEDYGGCPPCNGAEGSPELALAGTYMRWPGCQMIPQETTP